METTIKNEFLFDTCGKSKLISEEVFITNEENDTFIEMETFYIDSQFYISIKHSENINRIKSIDCYGKVNQKINISDSSAEEKFRIRIDIDCMSFDLFVYRDLGVNERILNELKLTDFELQLSNFLNTSSTNCNKQKSLMYIRNLIIN